MDGVDTAFSSLAQWVGHSLPNQWWSHLITDGVITGVGAVAVFIPQIVILFFALGLLESSGYLARGAVLVDRPLSMIGLNGKSFVPLLSGFACAIPAMMAAGSPGAERIRANLPARPLSARVSSPEGV